MIGTVLGNYHLVEKIGEGGMGQVYRATDSVLQRDVAIKVLHHHVTQDAHRYERFRSEAMALAKLNHPNIATLYNFFERDDGHFMVMEYVDGETFESLVRRLGALPLRHALELFCQSLRGFEHAHSRQVIHRDIKPSNLMLNSSGVVKIMDFGIARVMGTNRMTRTGMLVGTLEYMSPEQVRGAVQDERSDIYSLGILLYEMVTGRVPFSSESDFEIMRAHTDTRPAPPREFVPGLPEELDAAIQRSLEKEPAARFQTVGELRGPLEQVLQRLPVEAPVITPHVRETRWSQIPAPDPAVKGTRQAGAQAAPLPRSPRLPTLPWPLPRGALIGGAGAALVTVLGLVLWLNQASVRPHPPSDQEIVVPANKTDSVSPGGGTANGTSTASQQTGGTTATVPETSGTDTGGLQATGPSLEITTNELRATVGKTCDAQLDANGRDLEWGLIDPDLPKGLSLNESGVLSGIPETVGDHYSVSVTVKDPRGRRAQREIPLRVEPWTEEAARQANEAKTLRSKYDSKARDPSFPMQELTALLNHALQRCDRALRLNPEEKLAAYERGEVSFRMEHYDEAIQWNQEWRQKLPNDQGFKKQALEFARARPRGIKSGGSR